MQRPFSPRREGDLPSGAGLTASPSSTLAPQSSARPSDAQPAASSADVCPEVWGMQLDAMYPEIRPNSGTSSEPTLQRTQPLAGSEWPPLAGDWRAVWEERVSCILLVPRGDVCQVLAAAWQLEDCLERGA